jgi:hypothetical protein
MLASWTGHAETVKELIGAGADLNKQNDVSVAGREFLVARRL